MAEVQLAGIEKRFDGVRVLESLDLTVDDGEFVVLLGPSGCGKTTALRIIAGLERPTAGQVRIGGRDVTGLSPRERDVAMVFQSYALYPHMSIEDNIGYPLRIRKVSDKDRAAAVAAVAASLEISHLLKRRPRQLSGGQRQRIALARAIIRDPAAFLMDEPLSNLDAKLRISMRGEIRRLQQRLGATTIYVTHDQAEALTMADRVCLISDGVVQQYAPPQEIFDRPANRFVASFVGNPPMNILSIGLDPERRAMVVAGAAVPLGERYDACAAAGVEQLGVRARDLSITAARESRGRSRRPSMSSNPWGTRCTWRCLSVTLVSRSEPIEGGRRRWAHRSACVSIRPRPASSNRAARPRSIESASRRRSRQEE